MTTPATAAPAITAGRGAVVAGRRFRRPLLS
jgi:hypothetical protein